MKEKDLRVHAPPLVYHYRRRLKNSSGIKNCPIEVSKTMHREVKM